MNLCVRYDKSDCVNIEFWHLVAFYNLFLLIECTLSSTFWSSKFVRLFTQSND